MFAFSLTTHCVCIYVSQTAFLPLSKKISDKKLIFWHTHPGFKEEEPVTLL